MISQDKYAETSTAMGLLFIALGSAIWLSNYYFHLFTDWSAAVVIGGLWVALGTLFLFSDIRLYQFDKSPVEELLAEDG